MQADLAVASLQQIAANRVNASKSTGPRTQQGKLRSRRNALRHGLTAETVIDVIEDPDDYRRFEIDIFKDHAPRTTVEQELVARLASLLWRLRRATAIESGLLQIQGEILQERGREQNLAPLDLKLREGGGDVSAETVDLVQHIVATKLGKTNRNSPVASVSKRPSIACCFLRLANLENGLIERIGRYEVGLWRQVMQVLILLRTPLMTCKNASQNRALLNGSQTKRKHAP